MMKSRIPVILLALAVALALTGCSATQFNRQLEDAFGSMARTKVTRIGSATKECWLVKLNISKAYAVVVPNRILRLGEEFPQVSVATQFSGDGVDYAVLQCVRANGSVENFLLQAFSSTRLELYRLDSDSRSSFTLGASKGSQVLMQDMGSGKVRYWYVAPSSVRGPSVASRSRFTGTSARKSSKSTKSTAAKSDAKSAPENVDLPMADLPAIKQDTSVKLEVDTPPESAAPAAKAEPEAGEGGAASGAAPATKAEPYVLVEPKVSSGAAPASSGAPAKPYTIVVD